MSSLFQCSVCGSVYPMEIMTPTADGGAVCPQCSSVVNGDREFQ